MRTGQAQQVRRERRGRRHRTLKQRVSYNRSEHSDAQATATESDDWTGFQDDDNCETDSQTSSDGSTVGSTSSTEPGAADIPSNKRDGSRSSGQTTNELPPNNEQSQYQEDLDTLTRLAGDHTGRRVVVASIRAPTAQDAVVTAGLDNRERLRFQILARDMTGAAVHSGTLRGNSIRWADLIAQGATLRGRFRSATLDDIRTFATAKKPGMTGPALPLRDRSPSLDH